MRYPFEVPYPEIEARLDAYVDAVFSSLESEFLILPKGEGFIEYSHLEQGYEALKRGTSGFARVAPDLLFEVVSKTPVALIVLRTMLGFTPPEWAYVASKRTGTEITQGAVLSLDRKIRMGPLKLLGKGEQTIKRIRALLNTASALLQEGAPGVESDEIHRLDKADTRDGLPAIRTMAEMGIPYAMLLYERFLGRPFAGHRDSVSELVGGGLETKIEGVLSNAGVTFRKTKRAERVPGFDQAPDFMIPSEFSPRVIIEAKITEDDGTARDKVTRIQHLQRLSLEGQPEGQPKYQVVACIAGRGFGVRREDMRKLLQATGGKVFTLRSLDRMVEHTTLKEFRTR